MKMLAAISGSYEGGWPPAPSDDYWYTPLGGPSLAGVSISEDTARKISTVYRCVAILAGLVAYLPLFVLRRDGKNKEPAPNHPLYDVLHDQPNEQQTSFEWREMGMGHLLLRGNFYNEILEGPRGFADQLVPLHPDTVKPRRIPGSRRIVYPVRRDDGRTDVLVQEQVFHLRGPSKDGVVGLNVIDLARESMGLATAAEQFGARMFSQRPMMAGILKHPGKLAPEISKRVAESFVEKTSGPYAHRPAVLEDGLDWVNIGVTPEQAQFLDTRRFEVSDLCRWFGVPLVLVGETEKSTSWGSGIESIMIGFVQTTLGVWLKRWEQAIKKDLILAPQYFVEFVMDALLRGTTKERYEAFSIATGGRAWMSPNEVRVIDNLNTVDGYDEISKEAQGAAKAPAALPRRDTGGGGDQTRHYAEQLAARIVRKEIESVQAAIRRHASDAAALANWADLFYARLALQIARELRVAVDEAERYAAGHRAALTNGLAGIESWERDAAPVLVDLALGEEVE